MNEKRRLGHNAYWLMMFEKISAGAFLLVIAIILQSLRGPLTQYMTKSFAGGVITSASVATTIATIVLGLIILAIVVILITIIIVQLWYHFHTFVFEEFDLHLTRGILNIIEVSIPYRQMQDINVERTILHRLTGTARVIIDSAGHDDAGEHSETDIVLDPIDRDLAEDIRLILQRKIGVQVVETEKEADTEARSGDIHREA